MEHSISQLPEKAGVRIDQAIEDGAETAFAFLERLVRHPSFSGAESGAQQELADELERLGLAIEWLAVDDAVADDPAAGVPSGGPESQRVLVAQSAAVSGGAASGRSLVINGHLDVVPPGDEGLWTEPPFEPVRRDGWLYGRGAGDMKAGFAMTTLALRAIGEALPGFPAAQLTVVGVPEEENSGNGTLASVRAGITADAVLLPEPTGLDLFLTGEGVVWLEITVHGQPAHAEVASEGVSALDHAIELIGELRKLQDEFNAGDGDVHHELNIGTLVAGDWPSSVPASAKIGIRVGFPRGWTVADAEGRVREAIAAAAGRDPWLSRNPPVVRASGLRAAGYEIAADEEFVQVLRSAHHDAHGEFPSASGTAATTDARHYRNELGVPTLCYGPRARNIHAVDEAVELATIVAGARTLARFMATWLGTVPAGEADS